MVVQITGETETSDIDAAIVGNLLANNVDEDIYPLQRLLGSRSPHALSTRFIGKPRQYPQKDNRGYKRHLDCPPTLLRGCTVWWPRVPLRLRVRFHHHFSLESVGLGAPARHVPLRAGG